MGEECNQTRHRLCAHAAQLLSGLLFARNERRARRSMMIHVHDPVSWVVAGGQGWLQGHLLTTRSCCISWRT